MESCSVEKVYTRERNVACTRRGNFDSLPSHPLAGAVLLSATGRYICGNSVFQIMTMNACMPYIRQRSVFVRLYTDWSMFYNHSGSNERGKCVSYVGQHDQSMI